MSSLSRKIANKVTEEINKSEHKGVINLVIIVGVFALLSYALVLNLMDGQPYTGTKIAGIIICSLIILICLLAIILTIRNKIKQKK